jgi:hypothetical protein
LLYCCVCGRDWFALKVGAGLVLAPADCRDIGVDVRCSTGLPLTALCRVIGVDVRGSTGLPPLTALCRVIVEPLLGRSIVVGGTAAVPGRFVGAGRGPVPGWVCDGCVASRPR